MGSYKTHINFLELELKKQTDDYISLVSTPVLTLLQLEEVFTAQFMKFDEGLIIVRFKSDKPVPRPGQYLTAVLLSDERRSYRSWDHISWADLRKHHQLAYSEAVCVWTKKYDGDFYIAGFRGIDLELAHKLVQNCLITFGPKEPPFSYLQNLVRIVSSCETNKKGAKFLDMGEQGLPHIPFSISEKKDIPGFIISQLELSDQVIIQGPPGTGKTYLVAEILKRLLEKGSRVLASSLTNRALMELARKEQLQTAIQSGNVFKSSLSADEQAMLPGLQPVKGVHNSLGALNLFSFFAASEIAADLGGLPPLFDYVIIDEASQALLATFEMLSRLGIKLILIGDTAQLPPVTSLNEDVIKKKGFEHYVNGLRTLCGDDSMPYFQLVRTYRLTKRAAAYTSFFYSNPLESCSPLNNKIVSIDSSSLLLNPLGGPILIKTEMTIGDDIPLNGIALIEKVVRKILSGESKSSVAVLAKTRKTVRAIQRYMAETDLLDTNDILVDTVERIQGLTCDYVVLFIPNSKMNLSLRASFFNVATSRARINTVIIADPAVTDYSIIDNSVKDYLKALDREQIISLVGG